MMLSQNKSRESSKNGTNARPSPARYRIVVRRRERMLPAGRFVSGMSGGSSLGLTGSTLPAEADFLRADLAEQAGRTDDEDGEENQEPDRLLQLRVDVVARERFNQPDDHAAEVRAGDAAQST